MTAWEDFFRAGGALEASAPSYVTRQADQGLWQAVLSGEYCHVLTARQMGKSSLMIRMVSRLQSQGMRTVIIDLALMGTGAISGGEWYLGLVSQFKRQLKLDLDEVAWWTERQGLGPVQRFSDFLRQVVLAEVQEPIVVFVDEIDSTLSLPFTDDFFTAIRAAYNARASDDAYKRLIFVLLGVARPADLIKKRTRTPYNIGVSIDLQDFSGREAHTLLTGLQTVHPQYAEAILARVLYWTDGHPYLTQKVCAEVVAGDGYWSDGRIDRLIERLFLTQEVEEARKETNLQFIRDRILKSHERAEMLRVYGQVRAGKRVKDEERSVAKSQLKLSGLVKATSGGELVVRNRIYEHVFDAEWVKENMPASRAWRVAMVAVAVAVLATLILGYLVYRDRTLPNSIKAEQYTASFQSATSPEVRLNNLANLFRLGGYDEQACDLFFGLSAVERLRLFVGLSDPGQVGTDVLTVAEGIYQDRRVENNPEYNQFLRAIAEVLHQVEGEVHGAHGIAEEIDYWLAGRNKTLVDDFEAAIEQYDLALGLNEANPAVHFDRGMAYAGLTGYPQALADLQGAAELGRQWEEKVGQAIWQDPELFTYLGERRSEYAIAALFPTLTPTPIPPTPTPADTLTPTPTPTLIPTPTYTPIPMSTPTPTRTSIPTPTPTPTLTPTPTVTARTPTPTHTPIPTISGKLAVPIDNRAGYYDVWIYQLPGGEVKGVILGAHQPNLSSDGTKVVVNGEGSGSENVWEYNVDGSGGRDVGGFAVDAHPFYNPDGNSIVLDSYNLFGKGWQIFLRHGLGPGDRRFELTVAKQEVILDPNTPLFPLWDRDHNIIFRGCDYWQLPAGGQTCGIWKKAQNQSPPYAFISDPGAIPTDTKGDKVMYMSHISGNWEVHVTSIDGGEGVNITTSPAEDGLGTISPDGNWVAFVSNRDGRWGVWVTSTNGDKARRLDFIEIPGWPGEWTHERLSWGP
jgi:hypothetical protein